MSIEFTEILFSALGVIITGLASFLVAKLTAWIDCKIKDKQTAEYLSTILTLTTNAVKEVSQTYVETLKKEGKFDKEAQCIALNTCLAKIESQLAPELMHYIVNNFGDCTEYLRGLIESVIYNLKNNK